jgi:hypothetical protein
MDARSRRGYGWLIVRAGRPSIAFTVAMAILSVRSFISPD